MKFDEVITYLERGYKVRNNKMSEGSYYCYDTKLDKIYMWDNSIQTQVPSLFDINEVYTEEWQLYCKLLPLDTVLKFVKTIFRYEQMGYITFELEDDKLTLELPVGTSISEFKDYDTLYETIDFTKKTKKLIYRIKREN